MLARVSGKYPIPRSWRRADLVIVIYGCSNNLAGRVQIHSTVAKSRSRIFKWEWFEIIFLWNILWEAEMINCFLMQFLPVYLRITVFLTNQGRPVIILSEMFWTTSSFAHWRSFLRASQAGPSYESLMWMYIVWIESLKFIRRGLCHPSIGCSVALMFFCLSDFRLFLFRLYGDWILICCLRWPLGILPNCSRLLRDYLCRD